MPLRKPQPYPYHHYPDPVAPILGRLGLPPVYLHHPSELAYSRRLLGEGGGGEGGPEGGGGGAREGCSQGDGKRRASEADLNSVPAIVCGWREREIQCQQAEGSCASRRERRGRKCGDVTERASTANRLLTPLTFRPLPERFLFHHYEDRGLYTAQYRTQHTVGKVGKTSAEAEDVFTLEGFYRCF